MKATEENPQPYLAIDLGHPVGATVARLRCYDNGWVQVISADTNSRAIKADEILAAADAIKNYLKEA